MCVFLSFASVLYYFGPSAFLAPTIVRLICMHRWSKTPNYRRNIDLIIRASRTPIQPDEEGLFRRKAWRNGRNKVMLRAQWRQKKKMFAGNTARNAAAAVGQVTPRRAYKIYVFNIFCRDESDGRDERARSERKASPLSPSPPALRVWSLPGITHSARLISCRPRSASCAPLSAHPCFARARSGAEAIYLRALFARASSPHCVPREHKEQERGHES